MSDTVWNNSDADNDGNNPNNWSDGLPVAGKRAVFDNTNVANCVFSSGITCDGIRTASNYSGDIDMGDSLSHSWGSDGVVLGHSGNFDCGAGTSHTVAGSFDWSGHTGTFTGATATWTMTGAGTTITGDASGAKRPWKLVIEANVTTGSHVNLQGHSGGLTVDGATLTIDTGHVFICLSVNAAVTNSGAVAGGGELRVNNGSLTTLSGTITVATLRLMGSGTMAAGTYDSANVLLLQDETAARTRVFGGATTFTGDVTIRNTRTAAYTLDLDTNSANVRFGGAAVFDIDSSGGIAFSMGAGSIQFDGDITDQITGSGELDPDSATLLIQGSADQDVDGCGATWGDILMNKSAGTVTLQGGLAGATFTGADGTLDPNGQTVTTTGDCIWSDGFDFASAADTMNGCSWVVSGDFTADNQTMNATAAWTLTVTGTAEMDDCDVEYCDASGGSSVDCYDSVSGGDNVNLLFNAADLLMGGLLCGSGLLGGGPVGDPDLGDRKHGETISMVWGAYAESGASVDRS